MFITTTVQSNHILFSLQVSSSPRCSHVYNLNPTSTDGCWLRGQLHCVCDEGRWSGMSCLG